MSTKRDNAAIVGIGAAACATCCAGPILGFIAALGLGTLAGALLFGTVGLAVAGIAAVVLIRRRHRTAKCATAAAVDMPTIRTSQ